MAETVDKQEIKQRAFGSVVAGVVVLALASVVGVTYGARAGMLAFVAFIAVTAMSRSIGEVSIPFLLSLVAVLLLLAEFVLPDVVVSSFDAVVAIIESYLGVSLAGFDAIQFAVLAFAAIMVIWIFQIRGGRYGAKKPETIFKRIANQKIPSLAEIYADIGRRTVALGFALIAIVAIQLGGLMGDIAMQLSDFPVAASNVVTGLIGYLAIGGELPAIGEVAFLQAIGPGVFAVIVAIIFALAIGVRNAQ